ncbi:MAG: urea carboxylase-associated family protein [Moraxellaceae bacterium]|nr:urea carboxylase-associated family protein [Moraxellaceae bacterium]
MSFRYNPDLVVLEEMLRGGMSRSYVVKRGHALRLTADAAGANVSLLMFNADQLLERYNMPDTLKSQHTFMLTQGHVCYSDMGHALMSVIGDSTGWIDTIGGVSNRALVSEKYGASDYQTQRNDWVRSGRDLLLVELGKHGLNRRDLVANLNVFSKVSTDADGNLAFQPGHAQAGSCVDLRADMNVLVVMAVVQHPLDPSPLYAPVPVKAEIWQCGIAKEEDVCRLSRAENARGLANTARCFCQH